MARFSSSGGNSTTTILGVNNPDIQNIPLPTANVEVTLALPSGCKRFLLKLRDKNKMQLSFSPGDSATTYVTIWAGCVYMEKEVDPASLFLYVQSPVDNQMVELITWT